MSFPFVDPSTESKLPPLRIHHFMLWTAVTALMLTVYKTDENTNQFSSSMLIGGVPSTLLYSVCLTGLLLGCYWRRQGYSFFDQPGQMAFLLHGIFGIYSIFVAGLASYRGISPESTDGLRLVLVISSLGWVVICIAQLVMYFSYARRFSTIEYWSKFFRAAGLITLLQYVLFILVPLFGFRGMAAANNMRSMMISMFALPAVLGILELYFWFRAVKYDYVTGTSYHWTHWIGAGTWPAFRLVNVGIFVLILLFTPA